MTRTVNRLQADNTRPDAGRWEAVVARDRAHDGQFVFSVATTGVYCRPSCPSRRANRGNVAFHDTPDDAEAAGFRPCKRCRPRDQAFASRDVERIADACRAIKEADAMPSLAELAAAAQLSRFHFHRLFKAVTGMTPKAYSSAERCDRARDELQRQKSVTDAAFAAGFGSTARFYAGATRMLGMHPSVVVAGGKNTTLSAAVRSCALGRVLVAATRNGIACVLLGHDAATLRRDLQARFPKATIIAGDLAFEALVDRVVASIDAARPDNALPLDVKGTVFQHKVWAALRAIPVGKTATYADIAAKVGVPTGARAVAQACAANPAAVLIPCHRVVRGDGTLSGYRWGGARKRALLAQEGVVIGRAPNGQPETGSKRAARKGREPS